jgi:hypothetical protein
MNIIEGIALGLITIFAFFIKTIKESNNKITQIVKIINNDSFTKL